MRTFFLLFFQLFITLSIYSQAVQLSSKAQISLLTCSPGNELYSTFGHSAFRIKDPDQALDLVFNYGTFNMGEANFYVKFVKGHLNYMLSLSYYDQFMFEYIESKRIVEEQVLNLTKIQQQKIFDYLVWNHQPENKYYLYDFFFDNCATRFRELLPLVLGSKNIVYDKSVETNKQTFRDLLDIYLQKSPWEHLGINIVLGAPTDNLARMQDYMFLPDYLHDAFDKAFILDSSGVKQNLVSSKSVCYKPNAQPETNNGLINPFVVNWTIFIIFLFLTFLEFKKKKYIKILAIFDSIFFYCIGILGALIIFLWFFTDHKVVVRNWNIIWALPLHLLFAFTYSFKKIPTWIRYMLLFVFICTLLLIVTWYSLPQRLDVNLIPIVLVIGIRSFSLYKNRN